MQIKLRKKSIQENYSHEKPIHNLRYTNKISIGCLGNKYFNKFLGTTVFAVQLMRWQRLSEA